jgi:hypothetical protein
MREVFLVQSLVVGQRVGEHSPFLSYVDGFVDYLVGKAFDVGSVQGLVALFRVRLELFAAVLHVIDVVIIAPSDVFGMGVVEIDDLEVGEDDFQDQDFRGGIRHTLHKLRRSSHAHHGGIDRAELLVEIEVLSRRRLAVFTPFEEEGFSVPGSKAE